MTTDPNEPNPYRSPPEVEVSGKTADQGPPWRILPALLLLFCGGWLTLTSLISLFMLFGGCSLVDSHGSRASADEISIAMIKMFLCAVQGCFAMAAGRYVWKRRWKRCAVAVTVAVILWIVVFLVI